MSAPAELALPAAVAWSRSLGPRTVTALADLTDEGVVRRVLGGDREAYGVLVKRYERRIVAHVLRIVGNRESALEIAQDAFLKAYQALARFDDRYRFSTWLYAIAGNAAIDHVRQAKNHTVSLDEPMVFDDSEEVRELAGPARTAEEIVSGQQLAELLESAILRLPPHYRRLLLLRHPAGMSYDEIAQVTNLPLGTVKNRIFRARQALKEMLGDVLPADA